MQPIFVKIKKNIALFAYPKLLIKGIIIILAWKYSVLNKKLTHSISILRENYKYGAKYEFGSKINDES